MHRRGADFRHTSHGSPQATPKYGKAAPVEGTVPIKGVCSFSQVVIESLLSIMSLHSLQNAVAKVVKICRLTATLYKKVGAPGFFRGNPHRPA